MQIKNEFPPRVLYEMHGKENIHCDHFSSEPGPAATMVGNIVMGTRIGGAAGREIADIEEDSDMARKVLTQIQYPYPTHKGYLL